MESIIIDGGREEGENMKFIVYLIKILFEDILLGIVLALAIYFMFSYFGLR